MQKHCRVSGFLICVLCVLHAQSNFLACDKEKMPSDIAKYPLIDSLLRLRSTALEKILVETTEIDMYNLIGKGVLYN